MKSSHDPTYILSFRILVALKLQRTIVILFSMYSLIVQESCIFNFPGLFDVIYGHLLSQSIRLRKCCMTTNANLGISVSCKNFASESKWTKYWATWQKVCNANSGQFINCSVIFWTHFLICDRYKLQHLGQISNWNCEIPNINCLFTIPYSVGVWKRLLVNARKLWSRSQ